VINVLKSYHLDTNSPTWVFPGLKQDKPLSIRSAQRIFESALKRTGIKIAASLKLPVPWTSSLEKADFQRFFSKSGTLGDILGGCLVLCEIKTLNIQNTPHPCGAK
jgi:hypothetical protein